MPVSSLFFVEAFKITSKQVCKIPIVQFYFIFIFLLLAVYDSDEELKKEVFDLSALPTAPRASRNVVDTKSLPSEPPYTAFLGNLPYDVEETDIVDFFGNLKVNILHPDIVDHCIITSKDHGFYSFFLSIIIHGF